MKTILISFLMAVFTCNIASAQITQAELQVAGLTCSMCSRAVDKQLRTLDFIDSVGIDLSNAKFILFFKKNKSVDFYKIKNKVEDAGFSVALLQFNYSFTNLKIENNSEFNYQNMNFYFVTTSPQTLNGKVLLRIVDKGFVDNKTYKKYANQFKEITNSYHVII